MRKSLLALGIFILSVSASLAQVAPTDSIIAPKDTSWKKGGFISLNFAQTSFTNWAAGGENSVALNGLFNGFANYKTENTSWENSLDLAYGSLQTGSNPMRKSDDRIELNSKFGKKATGKFFYSALLNFKTQFLPGFNYPNDSVLVSEFATPAYLSVAIGMDYKPTDYFSVFLSPATGKLTIVSNQSIANQGTYGNEAAVYDTTTGALITKGKMIRFEFGAYMAAKFQKDIFKNVNLLAKLSLFDNYTDKVAENRGNIDVNFETLLTLKVNKFLSAMVSANVIYDHDIMVPVYGTVNGEKTEIGKGRRTQIKEVMGIGIAYKF